MRLTTLLVALIAALPAAGIGQVTVDADISAARDTALAQLEAFRRGDFDRAYGYASEVIRRLFDREAFERMVRGGYPQIAAPASVTVDRAERTAGGSIYLLLRIRGIDGTAIEATYEMVREAGGWAVNGVVTR